MKLNFQFFLLLCILSFLVDSFKLHKNIQVLSIAFKEVIKHLHDTNKEISVINVDAMTETKAWVVKCFNDENVPIKLINGLELVELNISRKFRIKVYKVYESTVLLFDSVQTLKNFNSKAFLMNEFPKHLQFFVHCSKATVDEIMTVASQSSEILPFQYFLVENENSLKILSFEVYATKKCDTTLTEVNKFIKTSRTWENSKFAIKKLTDFNGCELLFGSRFQNPALMFHPISLKPLKFHYYGVHYKILLGLSANLNFKFDFNPLNARTNKPEYPEKSVDTMISYGKIQQEKAPKTFFVTHPYMLYNDLIAVPPGEKYNSYEKMIFPFDFDTWMWILISFVAAFLSIFIINFTPSSVKNFVFGRNVSTPSLNVLMLFFGVSQVTEPRRNFARYLVMMFIIYTLIIRTAYQSLMFEMMQKEMTKSEVQSIEDFINKNYSLHIHDGVFQDYELMELLKR